MGNTIKQDIGKLNTKIDIFSIVEDYEKEASTNILNLNKNINEKIIFNIL
jgi:hypothetical protein